MLHRLSLVSNPEWQINLFIYCYYRSQILIFKPKPHIVSAINFLQRSSIFNSHGYYQAHMICYFKRAIIKEAAQIPLIVPLALAAGSLRFQPAALSQRRRCSPHHPARRRWMTQLYRAAVPSVAPVSHQHWAMYTQEWYKFTSHILSYIF